MKTYLDENAELQTQSIIESPLKSNVKLFDDFYSRKLEETIIDRAEMDKLNEIDFEDLKLDPEKRLKKFNYDRLSIKEVQKKFDKKGRGTLFNLSKTKGASLINFKQTKYDKTITVTFPLIRFIIVLLIYLGCSVFLQSEELEKLFKIFWLRTVAELVSLGKQRGY